MADIPQFAPERGDMVQAIWFEKWERWSQGIYVISGGCANEQGSPDMSIQVDEITTNLGTTAAGNVSIDAADTTQARMDVLYQTAALAFAIHKGDNLDIIDHLGNYNAGTYENWEQLVQPYPKASLPAGVPLYLIYVGPGCTAILDEYLMPIAAKGISGGNTKVRDEIPTGSGTSLTLAHSPAANTLQLFKNGVRLKEGSGNGYTISGDAITLTTALVVGDWFCADYEY